MKPPTKQEIREKYGISEEDFEVLVTDKMPTPDSLVREQVFLQKVGWYENFEVILKRSKLGGVVLMVAFIGSVGGGVQIIYNTSVKVVECSVNITSYSKGLFDSAPDQAKGLLVYTPPQPTPEDKEKLPIHLHQSNHVATGGVIVPMSGDYKELT